MQNSLFSDFAPMLRDMTDGAIVEETERPRRLLLDSSQVRGRRIDIAYAPFDHVNLAAKVVVIGLTPGRQQMRNALLQASRSLRSGCTDHDAAAAAKVFASFSGPMRANLVAMLDSIGVNEVLGLLSTSSLWNGDAHRVHFTSALRYPVFIDGKNYSGTPPIRSTPLLWQHHTRWFALEMKSLPDAIFVPLGPAVAAAVDAVAKDLGQGERVLSGLPHPSGANAERIAFFLGRKDREDLSSKVEPTRLLAARARLETKVSALLSCRSTAQFCR